MVDRGRAETIRTKAAELQQSIRQYLLDALDRAERAEKALTAIDALLLTAATERPLTPEEAQIFKLSRKAT
jgi:hypothetical protein